MKAIVTDAIMTGFSSRADRSLGFRGVTPELSSEEKAHFMDLQNMNVRLLIEPKDYSTDGKVEIKNPLGTKSPSLRLRSVLFVLHKQLSTKGKLTGTYDEFYVQQMETIINSYKEQLDPE
jgi:hypothetical protein